MKGVFLDSASVDPGDLDLRVLAGAVPQWQGYDATKPEQVQTRISDAAIVVSNKVALDAAVLQAASRLQLICVAATGTNNVDLAASRRLGITVCNVRRYATPAVVQHVFALILALTVRLADYGRAVRAGRWQASEHFCLLDFPIREISGKTLGILGHGELGAHVGAMARAFGMQVLIAERPGGVPRPGRIPLRELLPQVDALSLHCPLTAQTRGLISAENLARMKPDALLINTARGELVDEAALADALRQGRLGGAGIDVLSTEPPETGNPLLDADIPNLIVTPHIAWASRESRQRLIDEVAENIHAYLRGTPRNVVT